LLVAFGLGIVVTLAALVRSGGVYEYRVVGGADMLRLVNDDHWELVTGTNLPTTAYYLRRPRLRLP